MTSPVAPRVLVSDFDGTMTQRDFYQVYSERLMPPEAPDFWVEYRAGRMTHFDALKAIFSYVPAGEPALLGLTKEMQLEPDLAPALAALRAAGWEVVVVSAGCRWYIDRLLKAAGADIEVHANDGYVDSEGRLVMVRPDGTPFPSPDVGIDKAAVVQWYREAGVTVAFAGDGPPDVLPASFVPAGLRFAKGHLAEALAERGESYRPFERWRDIAAALVAEANGSASISRPTG
jgi:2,3-diketo-5-methylthio-1-phosphopentane phosphatase